MLIYLLYLLFGLLAIGFVIFLHELGHFTAARLLGVDVEVLSYGMGPKLFSFQGPKTEYRISLFLFGGYCRMKGSLDLMKALKDDARSMDKTEAGSYFGTTPVVRFLIYLAGPLMNFLLAVLLLALSSHTDKRIRNPFQQRYNPEQYTERRYPHRIRKAYIRGLAGCRGFHKNTQRRDNPSNCLQG